MSFDLHACIIGARNKPHHTALFKDLETFRDICSVYNFNELIFVFGLSIYAS